MKSGGSLPEGGPGTTQTLNLVVRLSRAVTYDVVVDWATANGTATGGPASPADYLAAGGSVTIPEGEVEGFIALSIFGDHSDVMAARSTGWAQLFASSVQEAADFALISQAAALEARVPFIHVFDGFRTSHEVQKVEPLTDDDLRALLDPDLIAAHRARALSPDHPFIRGTAQNPDVYFQARESVNPYYRACPAMVQQAMDRLGLSAEALLNEGTASRNKTTGRR